jgi:hypothetical protein
MVNNASFLIGEFYKALRRHAPAHYKRNSICHELLKAPHDNPDMPPAKCAVYVFSLASVAKCPAGANRVLKVGRVGQNSNARFKHQHYRPGSANSTLSASIKNNPILWKYLGVGEKVQDFGKWLRENTDRDHFFIDAACQEVQSALEVYLKGVLGPVFEGSQKASFQI